MPYYSELGIYTPSSSYTSPLIKGPYSNHSSIIASNILPLPKQIHRSNFRGFKPHLTTISESNVTAPLRRISSPKVIYHSSPKVRVQRPIKINTADIDVSVNKYKNYLERGSAEKRSPTSKPEIPAVQQQPPPQQQQQEKEAKPNTNIRRDRATIRLQTIHKDTLEKEIGTMRSWRDNFKPEELATEARVKRKSPGEILKEKFLIKSKSKENIPQTETPKLTRRPSVKKSASFKDICNVITSDKAIEDLNPGQPIDIRRRQSRQVSQEDIIKEIERTSSNLSQEEVELLDALIKAENEVGLYDTPPIIEDKPKTRRKKATRKKTVEGLIQKTDKTDPLIDTDVVVMKSTSEGHVPSSKLRKDSSLQNMVKDISQVEIEMIPVKQKPIITASVGDIEEKTKNNLKLVVEDYQVQESPTPPKKEKKFRFNVTVEEFPVKKKLNFPKHQLSDDDLGVILLPKAQPVIVNNIMKKYIAKQSGTITDEPKIFKRKDDPKMKKKLLKSLSEIQVRNKNDNALQKSGSNDSMCSNFTVLVNKSKSDEGFTNADSRTSSGKLKIISIEKNLTDINDTAETLIKTTRKDLKENTFLSKGDLGPNKKPQPLWAQKKKANKTSAVEEKNKESPKVEEDQKVESDSQKIETKEIQSPVQREIIPEMILEKKDKPKVDLEQKKPQHLWLQRDKTVPSVEEKTKESPKIETEEKALEVESQTIETKGVKTEEPNQSPVPDNVQEIALEDNDKSRVNLQEKKSQPLWIQRNKTTPSAEEETKESPKVEEEKKTLEVDSQKIKAKETAVEEIQPAVPDKIPAMSLEEKAKGNLEQQKPQPLWLQRNKSVEEQAKKTLIGTTEKEEQNTELSSLKLKSKEPDSNKLTPDKDKQKENTEKKPFWIQRNEEKEPVKSEIKETTVEEDSLKVIQTPEVDKPIESSSTDLLQETHQEPIEQTQNAVGTGTEIKLITPVIPRDKQDIETTEVKTPIDKIKGASESSLKKIKELDKKSLTPKSSPKTIPTGIKKSRSQEGKPTISASNETAITKNLKNEKKEAPQVSSIDRDESKQSRVTENNQLDNFWSDQDAEPYEPPVLSKLTLDISEVVEPESPEEEQKKMTSKRSLIQKANKNDPDLKIFEPPTPPPQEPVKEPSPEPSFVPLQSNRLSQWMHPWKKPEEKEENAVEIYAKPKFIRARHIPRRWQQNVSESEDSTTTDEDSSGEESDEDDEEEAEEGDVEEEEDGGVENKIGASTSSTDSGFESGRTKNKGSTDSRDSPGSTLNPASNPAFALDFNDLPEEVSQSSTYQSFQKSGRITPPATTIPRFRKYCVEDFNFLKVLGKGSFGKVLLAELKGTEYYYAVKCLKKDVVLEDDDVECTLIERKVLALGTKHPYLCHLLCTFQTESHLFFVMEYLNGGDLMFHIQMERRFSEARARFYGAEIVSGLKFLHNKGIVYRDLKLDNILLDFDGHVRIADFGMCKLQIFLDRMADTFCGTPDYMAPEIIKGQHYNQCVDWWSFGVLLYEMLLGQSPFSGCDEDELFWSICNEKPVIPRFLSAEATSVLTQFLEKDANKRLGNRFSPHGDIQDHPFFQPIDWPALEARKLEPPFKPNLQHPLDTQYFDKTFTTEKAKLTPIEGPILQSMDQTQFQGFSYTNPNATDK